MLYIINNSIKHQLFIQTQLDDLRVLFQTIQFGISTQFSCLYTVKHKTVLFQKFSLACIHSLNIKQFYLIIDRTLSGASTPGQSGLWSVGNVGYSTFPEAPTLQKPHYQIVSCHIQDTHWRGLTFCRDAGGVSCSIS